VKVGKLAETVFPGWAYQISITIICIIIIIVVAIVVIQLFLSRLD
jgi:hypothetical protein